MMNESGSVIAGGRKTQIFSGITVPIILVGVLVAIVLTLLFTFNPETHAFYPLCVFHRITGLLCPGCGGLRATHQLLHGNLIAAFKFNPLLVVAFPYLVACQSKKLLSRRGAPSHSSRALDWGMLSTLVLFGILRNFAFFKNYLAGL